MSNNPLEVFANRIDDAIKFHSNNQNDPYGCSVAVLTALVEVRDAALQAVALTKICQLGDAELKLSPSSERVSLLPDGYYYFGDPEERDGWGVMHRVNGKSWVPGAENPIGDGDWKDYVVFTPIPQM